MIIDISLLGPPLFRGYLLHRPLREKAMLILIFFSHLQFIGISTNFLPLQEFSGCP
jgi:hypothetical protein